MVRIDVAATMAVVLVVLVVLVAVLYITTVHASRANSTDIVLKSPPGYVPPQIRSRPRVGIVILTKNPIGFDRWLTHHRSIGIERIYVCVEDTPELVSKLRGMGDFVHVTVSTGTRSYFSLMERQERHVNVSIPRARDDGLTHLLHIDDDELLYMPSGKHAFDAELSRCDASTVHLDNIEAVYDQSSCNDPFVTTTHFCVRPSHFTSYANGKSLGALKDPTLRARGPHAFTGRETRMPSFAAIIIHYEGACTMQWAEKFTAYSKSTPEACKGGKGAKSDVGAHIPFKYYCDSIDAFTNRNNVSDPESVWRRWKLRSHRVQSGVIRIDDVVSLQR